ncbi:MAG TPA: SMP-30/gluconolactonase/LRE family protein [Steroidobacteraceae bacterium]|nr:SMP-30/gluconolactonase/LRE family protein [Steroidobacteraceae bacterium]
MREVRCVWPVEAQLGEGPFWSACEAALWFVDIKGRQIHRFDPAAAAGRSWRAPDQVSFVLPHPEGDLVVGLPRRLARFTPSTGAFADLIALEAERPGNRMNDACVDAAGRLWFGSMDDRESEPSGALYRWDYAAEPLTCDQGFVISNGPAFSPDGRTLYHTDSLRRMIYCFDVGGDGAAAGKRPFIEIEEGAGWPDGTSVDGEGCLWVALYGGWAVRRYSPRGELLEVVELPCANPTKLALGGEELKTAFVTSARKGLSAAERAAQPLAGALFAFEADVAGLACREPDR